MLELLLSMPEAVTKVQICFVSGFILSVTRIELSCPNGRASNKAMPDGSWRPASGSTVRWGSCRFAGGGAVAAGAAAGFDGLAVEAEPDEGVTDGSGGAAEGLGQG